MDIETKIGLFVRNSKFRFSVITCCIAYKITIRMRSNKYSCLFIVLVLVLVVLVTSAILLADAGAQTLQVRGG